MIYFDEVKKLNLPKYPFKIVNENGNLKILDPIRRKYLVLTPEEWVRQHFIQYLIGQLGFPKGLLKMEAGISVYQRKGRFDVLFLTKELKNLLLIECKAPDINLDQETLDQVLRYNAKTQAPYLALTNGMKHIFIKVDFLGNKLIVLNEVPTYQYLVDQINGDE